MKLSIIVPVYNEEKTINTILDLIEKSLESLTAVNSYEIVIIDDHSTDNSQKVLDEKVKLKENYIFFLLTHLLINQIKKQSGKRNILPHILLQELTLLSISISRI